MIFRSKLFKRILIGLVIFISVFGIIFITLYISLKNPRKNDKNPYEYNIDIYRKTPEKLRMYKEVEQIKISTGEPSALAVDRKGNIIVSAGLKILIFNNKGRLLDKFKTDTPAGCIAVDKKGNILLGVRDHVEIYDKKGRRIYVWAVIGEKADITSIAVKDNHVFIADYGHRVVWHYDRSGKLIGKIDRKDRVKKLHGFIIPSPYFDIVLNRKGALWIVNPGMQKVENFTYNGKRISSWGRPSMTVDGFAGCCNPTHIAIGPGGRFITAEKGIPRVKLYDADGRFRGFVAGTEDFQPDTIIEDIAVDLKGRVLVLDPKRRAVRIFIAK